MFAIRDQVGTKLAAETTLNIGGQSVELHTSCSWPLRTNDVFGAVKLVGFQDISGRTHLDYADGSCATTQTTTSTSTATTTTTSTTSSNVKCNGQCTGGFSCIHRNGACSCVVSPFYISPEAVVVTSTCGCTPAPIDVCVGSKPALLIFEYIGGTALSNTQGGKASVSGNAFGNPAYWFARTKDRGAGSGTVALNARFTFGQASLVQHAPILAMPPKNVAKVVFACSPGTGSSST